MTKIYKTPGVYVVEKNSFGSSIVSHETATPVFFGFTEFALDSAGKALDKVKGSTIVFEPVLIENMLDYQRSFGGEDTSGSIHITKTTLENGSTSLTSSIMNAEGTEPYTPSLIFPAVSNYFANGGARCYIISLGTFTDFEPSLAKVISDEFEFLEQGIKMADKATLILPTDLIRFGTSQYYDWATRFTNFAENQKKHFVILDVIQADTESSDMNQADIDEYREQVSPNFPSYAAAYYPNLKSLTIYAYKEDLSNVYIDDKPITEETSEELVQEVKEFLSSNYINLPPSPFMAGIYSRVDNATGVWTPPANVSPTGVSGPVVNLTNQQQENLNVDATAGKSINAIRNFTGRGTLVWGARTNDGNSMDWRYINVRRLVNSMEMDISIALEAYVFKPNVHNTWVEVKTMIESYLFGLYGQGAFAGTTPDTSYQVLIGRGETMTDEDILNGYMRVSIMIAPIRPAEFIVLTFSQMVGQ